MATNTNTERQVAGIVRDLTATIKDDEALVGLGKDGILETFANVREIVEAVSELRKAHDDQARRLVKLFGTNEISPIRTRATKDQAESALSKLDW